MSESWNQSQSSVVCVTPATLRRLSSTRPKSLYSACLYGSDEDEVYRMRWLYSDRNRSRSSFGRLREMHVISVGAHRR